ncbi:MAG: hypothetical protein PHN56_06755 [Candidatus Nanoarchaeia archaeon]|nr:hypothetical protein [Candidatus Nanoarchaeia archaeon]
MTNKKSQEMSIQTVVVLILIMIVLVVVIAFVVPQLTGIFGGMGQLGNSTSSQLNTNIDLSPKACYPITQATPGSPAVTISNVAAVAAAPGIPATIACVAAQGFANTCCVTTGCSLKKNEVDCLATKGLASSIYATRSCCKWTKVN